MKKMTYEDAIKLLKNAVKDSHLDNQKHIDLTLVDALERPLYEQALAVANHSVTLGERTRDELKQDLGLLT